MTRPAAWAEPVKSRSSIRFAQMEGRNEEIIMQLCTDKDLAILEPSLFMEAGFSHLKLVRGSVATVAGTSITTTANMLAPVSAGMVALLGSPGQLVEIVKILSTSSATISVLQVDASAPPVSPGLNGPIEFNVLSFRPVIEYASQETTETLGASGKATSGEILLRQAVICRTLSLLFMALTQSVTATTESAVNSGNQARIELWRKKSETYREQAESLRRQLSLRVDQDGDGAPETMLHGNVIELVRR